MRSASTVPLGPDRARRLLDLCVALNTVSDPDTLLHVIIETATELLDCAAASLLLFDEATGHLRFEAATGEQVDALAEIEVPLEGSIAGRIYLENRPVLVGNAANEEDHFKDAGEATGLQTEVLLGVPMRIDGKPVGVLEALNPRRGFFDATDVETLLIVSAQAAVAIRNARQRTALAEANARLSELDEMKNEFMAIASHELRTPVSIVLGFGAVLRDETDGHLTDMADAVLDAGERMQRIIETVEEVSKLQDQSVELDRAPLVLQHVLREAWTQAGAGAWGEGARLALGDTPLCVSADRGRLTLAVKNVLENAFAFTPASGTVELEAVQKGHEALVTVRDTGCGLGADDLSRVFDAFYQAEAHLSRSHEGLGVGLTVAQALVGLHGGHLWAESDGPGHGTSVYLRLPLCR